MKTLAAAAITLAAVVAVPSAAFAGERASAPAKVGVDLVGVDVDYKSAAESEGMTEPTSKYKISARFGQSGPMWSSGKHTGLDFAAPQGRDIVAADSGKVVEAGSAGAYGNMVEIAHGDGTRTRYAHLSRITVTKGQNVDRGQQVGDLGNTGNSSGPHLHFEVLVRGKAVDPEKFLNL